jgi:hypothetical protein
MCAQESCCQGCCCCAAKQDDRTAAGMCWHHAYGLGSKPPAKPSNWTTDWNRSEELQVHSAHRYTP